MVKRHLFQLLIEFNVKMVLGKIILDFQKEEKLLGYAS